MEREKLLKIRNDLICTETGAVLFDFMHDFVMQEACKSINADELKGMCRLIQELNSVPAKIK